MWCNVVRKWPDWLEVFKGLKITEHKSRQSTRPRVMECVHFHRAANPCMYQGLKAVLKAISFLFKWSLFMAPRGTGTWHWTRRGAWCVNIGIYLWFLSDSWPNTACPSPYRLSDAKPGNGVFISIQMNVAIKRFVESQDEKITMRLSMDRTTCFLSFLFVELHFN